MIRRALAGLNILHQAVEKRKKVSDQNTTKRKR